MKNISKIRPTNCIHAHIFKPWVHLFFLLVSWQHIPQRDTQSPLSHLTSRHRETKQNKTHTDNYTHTISQNSLLCTSWDHVTKMQHFLSLPQNLLFPESFPWVHEERNKQCIIQKPLPVLKHCQYSVQYLSLRGENMA